MLAFSQEIVEYILLGFAASLVTVGQLEIAARIFLNKNLKDRFFKKIELITNYIPLLIRTSFCGQIIDEVCNVIDSSDDSTLEMITIMSTILSSNSDVTPNFQKLLHKCLEKNIALADNTQIGVSHYNLANHYRAQHSLRKAVFHYVMAPRFEVKYLKQSYYYKELASIFFFLKKYHFAAKFYKIALDNGASDSVKPLYADSLMLSGKYLSAKQVFAEYLDSTEKMHSEWRLKLICLEQLINFTGIEEQKRKEYEAIEKIDTSKVNSDFFVNEFKSAIKLDCLCGPAWFNLGMERSSSGEHSSAAFCFTLCGLVHTEVIEAWINATLCCWNQEVPIYLFPLVIDAAYFFHKEDYLSKLQTKFATQLSGDALKNILNIIDELLPKNDDKGQAKVRVMGDDDIFRDIETGKNE